MAENETETGPVYEQKTRNCLMCRQPFESSWPGERVCKRCKSTSEWRSGTDFEAA